MTRRRSWVDPFFLTGDTIGNEFDDTWFYCYQFVLDVRDVYAQKAENFVDFGDVYLSFIFNLLANSLQIKEATEAMIEADDQHDTVLFVENLAKLMRIMLDFDSYQTVGEALEKSLKGRRVRAAAESHSEQMKRHSENHRID